MEMWDGDENNCNHRCELIRASDGLRLCDDAAVSTGCQDHVSAAFEQSGAIGIGFGFADAAQPSNQMQSQVQDGRPVCVTVTEIRPGSQAEDHKQIEPGMVLTHIAGASVSGLGFSDVDKMLVQAIGAIERPLELKFERPAVDLTGVRLRRIGRVSGDVT